jgi:hypothetical protein
MLERLSVYCYDRGLTINFKKSKILQIPAKQAPVDPDRSYSFPTMPDQQRTTMETTQELTYLGIPLTSTLSTKAIADKAISSIWSCFHAGLEAGMSPDGLDINSRMVAWNTFVLPHILFYLPFITKQQTKHLHIVANTTLCQAFDTWANAEAIRAEFGILPTEELWAKTVATLHGLLNTNHVQARAPTVYQTLEAVVPQKADIHPIQQLLTSAHLALHLLSLSDHWPRLDPSKLESPTREHHLALQTNHSPGASALAPWRHTWGLLANQQATHRANLNFKSMLNNKSHRLLAYAC